MFPYIRSIVITKETKLNRVSWIIWSTIGIINLAAYISAGEKGTIWFVIAAAINPIILLLLSLKFGEKHWYPIDTACIVLAALSLLLWRMTGNPILALVAGLVADFLGLVPTFIKVIRNPHSENLVSWLIGLLAGICNIIAVQPWTWASGIYTIYMVSQSILVIVPIVNGQLLRKTTPK